MFCGYCMLDIGWVQIGVFLDNCKFISIIGQSMHLQQKRDDTETVEASKMNCQTSKSLTQAHRNSTIQKKIITPKHFLLPTSLWKDSSQSLTRQRSPSHKIPNALRFISQKEEEAKNSHFLRLDLRKNIKTDNGINFTKSTRPEHWIKGTGECGPSPASYKYSRFLDQINYKSVTMRDAYNVNPESALNEFDKMRASAKGPSFTRFDSYEKNYLDHTRNRFYQPENTQGQPGPGQYSTESPIKKKSKGYSIRKALKRFNEGFNLVPGPSSYQVEKAEWGTSVNVKGTIQKSGRTYLKKFQDFPSPNQYAISRFLEDSP